MRSTVRVRWRSAESESLNCGTTGVRRLRLHLGNVPDRQYGTAFGNLFNSTAPDKGVG
jgi:hypothetical protein